MARLNITDLPRDVEISEEEMKRLRGGYTMKNVIVTGQGSDPLPVEEVTEGHDNWIEVLSF